MRRLRHLAVCVLCTAGFLIPAQLLGAASAQAATFADLTLINGWTAGPFGTSRPQVEILSGIVHLKGAIAGGTAAGAFVLPAAYRPATNVFVPVDLCNATNGRLDITPSGTVSVEQQNGDPFSNAQCFTSLDGVSFAKSATLFTALTLKNGWANAPFGTSNAAVRNVAGVIHFKGAIAGGTTGVAFTLPKAFRPAKSVFAPVDLCNATNGRLDIAPSGTVTVAAEGGTFSNAQCFTSLDGVSFVKTATGFSPLTLQNGWTGGALGTGTPQAGTVSGLVHLTGAMSTTGTNGVAFTLPAALVPVTSVYVKVDLCNGTNGRLFIQSTGVVTVQQKNGDPFSNAQCFTSLDGVWFNPVPFDKLTLVNGWTNSPFGTSPAAVTAANGIVHFSGAIATSGTNTVAFTLPPSYRPSTNVFVPVDLCNATNGRLDIAPSGVVSVEQQSGDPFSNAQCFTSLAGSSFSRLSGQFTALTLQNGWTNAPFGTSNAAARVIAGIVHLKGAVAAGTSGVLFTLPPVFRPATDVYVPVDLCNATNGRLHIQPNGVTDVEVPASGSFSNAQCFTSLDGVTFALSPAGFTSLTLQNGWANAPFSTSNAAATTVSGIVHLKGAVASGTTGVITTLPAPFRPATSTYVKVDLCGATNGRLFIQSNGVVTVQQQNGDPFSNAQCFTSLDGASFAP